MRKGFILAFGTLALLAGCGSTGEKAPGVPVAPKWKGLPYRLAIDTKQAKPNPAGITIPGIKFTANPEALETRATLIVHFDATSAKKEGPVTDQMIIGPFDISGTEGSLPADYMDAADTNLARLLGAYCMKGNIKMSVAIARSSLSPQAVDSEVTAKRLSDWLPVEAMFKNPHRSC